ncbi:MAG: cation-transporting P-type ATPase, partial [Bacteroidales bacterium]
MNKMIHQPGIEKEKWHSYEEPLVLKELGSSVGGLNSDEASKRLGYYGENKLPETKKVTLLQIILHQILNPLIFILIAAAIASVAIGEAKDAIFIFLVIFINSGLGTYQEYNAEKSAAGLQSMIKIKARVKRDGKETELDSEVLV